MAFFRTTLGKEIELRDHEGSWWDGVVLTPDAPRIQKGRNIFSLAVQFEGIPR